MVGGKCVAGDTYIYTDKGIMQIKDLYECDENGVEDYSPKLDIKTVNKDKNIVNVERATYNGFRKTKKIRTATGYELECSTNHPILIEKENSEREFVLADDLRVGDKVVMSVGDDLWNDRSPRLLNNKDDIDKIPKKIKNNFSTYNSFSTLDFAYFVGVMFGKGYITPDYKIRIYTKRTNVIKGCQKFLDRFGLKFVKKSGTIYEIENPMLGKYLDIALNLKEVSNDNINLKIPDIIMKSKREVIISFLKGFFDCRLYFRMVRGKIFLMCCKIKSKEFAKQIQLLLLNLGVVSYLVTEKDLGHIKNRLIIHIEDIKRFNDLFSFAHAKKGISPLMKTKIAEINHFDVFVKYVREYETKESGDKKYFITKISKIEDGEANVYDISVPDTHSFVSNGFISHNTWRRSYINVCNCYTLSRNNNVLNCSDKGKCGRVIKRQI